MADPSVSEQQPPPPHYPRLKLTYINGVRARAESIRLMFAHKSIPYEQELIEKADMPSYKEKLLFNQLPMLQVDGREIVQSGSICRYVAKIAGLVPEDLVEAAQCDSVFEFGMDNCYVITRCRAGHPFPGELPKEEFFSRQTPSYGVKHWAGIRSTMEKVLGDKKFFTGESPMYCDFMMFNALCCAKAAKEDCLDGAGSLNAFVGRMMALPGVAAYMEAEPWREIAPKDFPEGLHQPS